MPPPIEVPMGGSQPTRRWAGGVALTLALLSAGGCAPRKETLHELSRGTADWDHAVDRTIPEADRARRLKALGRELAAVQRAMAEDFVALNERAVDLNARYESTIEDAHALAGEYVARRREAYRRYRELVLEMRGAVSAPEWKELAR
jgi:hypothetical protein